MIRPSESMPPETTHDEEDIGELPEAPRPRARSLAAAGLGVAVVLGALFAFGLVPKLAQRRALHEDAEKIGHTAPVVNVVRPRQIATAGGLALPASLKALREAMIFARTSGYVKRRLVDIGDQVKEGQLLLELETPEVEQELLSAMAKLAKDQASVEQEKSTLMYSRTSRDRNKALVAEGIASQQDAEQREAALMAAEAGVRAAEASVNSSQAEVRRLMEQKAFARVVSPFAGTVTSRGVEVGQLVNAGSSGASPLFTISQSNPVRALVSVPQSFAPLVRAADKATVTVREYGDRAFVGAVARTSAALDPVSRTMLCEVEIPNDDGALLPGMYAQVKLAVQAAHPPLLVPVGALLLMVEGPHVAVVGEGSRVHLQKVVVESDYGVEVGITSGLRGDELVVSNPSERLAEGVVVTVAAPPAAVSASTSIPVAVPAVPGVPAVSAVPAALPAASGAPR